MRHEIFFAYVSESAYLQMKCCRNMLRMNRKLSTDLLNFDVVGMNQRESVEVNLNYSLYLEFMQVIK